MADAPPVSPTDKKGVANILDLEKEEIELKVADDISRLDWKLNTSPTTIDNKETLKQFVVTPPVKRIDLHFPLGIDVTARNLKGVTVKDALDAIYKQFKKRADDELDKPILADLKWDKEESWTRLIVFLKQEGMPVSKKKKGKGDE